MSSLYSEIAEAARVIRAQGMASPVAVLVGPIFQGCCLQRESAVHLMRGILAGYPIVMPLPACEDATFAVRVAAALGARTLVLGLEARGLSPRLRGSEFMVFSDHINATGANPLTGLAEPRFGPCFLDMSEPYDAALQAVAETSARALGLVTHRGVYLDAPGCLSGTDDDFRAMRALGADALGAGGVAEAIVGVQAGLKVLGLAFVSRDGLAKRRPVTRLSQLLAVAETCVDEIESRT